MSPVRQIGVKITAWVPWTPFWISITCDIWRSFSPRRTFQILKSDIQAKLTAKCPMDKNIDKLSWTHPCGCLDTYSTHMAPYGQGLERLEVLHFWHTLESENLRFGSTVRPTKPRSTQRVYKQEVLDVGVQKPYIFTSYSQSKRVPPAPRVPRAQSLLYCLP